MKTKFRVSSFQFPALLIPLLLNSIPCLGAPPPTPIRVACVGDSITYGKGIADRKANCYPAVLARLLGKGYEVRNFGVSGTTALRRGDFPYWVTPEFAEATEFAPQIVVIMLGTNDAKPDNWWAHRSEFEGDYDALVAHFTALATKPRVLVCLPPPMFGFFRRLEATALKSEVLPRIGAVAARRRLAVADVFAVLAGRRDLLPDGVHPNAEGAAVIARTVCEALTKQDERRSLGFQIRSAAGRPALPLRNRRRRRVPWAGRA